MKKIALMMVALAAAMMLVATAAGTTTQTYFQGSSTSNEWNLRQPTGETHLLIRDQYVGGANACLPSYARFQVAVFGPRGPNGFPLKWGALSPYGACSFQAIGIDVQGIPGCRILSSGGQVTRTFFCAATWSWVT